MSWIAAGGLAIGAAGSIAGGIMGGSGAKKQAQAMREAIEYQKQKDRETQQRFSPYQELGKESVNEFKQWRDDPNKDPMNYLDPAYNFRRDQGMKAVTGNAATSGMLQSGDTLRALEQFGQDYSGGEYNNAFNRWLQEGTFDKGMVDSGQSAAGWESQLANQGAANVGHLTANADFGAQDNVWADVASGLGGMTGNALARRFSPTPSASTPGGSNIFQVGGSGGNMQAQRLGLGGGYQLDPRYR